MFLVAWQGHIFTDGISQAISEESETRRERIDREGLSALAFLEEI